MTFLELPFVVSISDRPLNMHGVLDMPSSNQRAKCDLWHVQCIAVHLVNHLTITRATGAPSAVYDHFICEVACYYCQDINTQELRSHAVW